MSLEELVAQTEVSPSDSHRFWDILPASPSACQAIQRWANDNCSAWPQDIGTTADGQQNG